MPNTQPETSVKILKYALYTFGGLIALLPRFRYALADRGRRNHLRGSDEIVRRASAAADFVSA